MVIYYTPKERAPLKGYQKRVQEIMEDVQSFYRNEMKQNGWGEMTFPLEYNEDGSLKIRIVSSSEKFRPDTDYKLNEMRDKIQEALKSESVDIGKSHYIVFQNLYWQEEDKWLYRIPYTGCGRGYWGMTWVADHENLNIRNIAPGITEMINDRGKVETLTSYCCKMIGGVAHELGHGLGLPHNCETPEEKEVLGTALMGAGNYTYRRERAGTDEKGSFITAAHCMALAVHEMFRKNNENTEIEPEIKNFEIDFKDLSGKLRIKGKVESTLPLHGIVVYNDELPTGVNQDYDAFSFAVNIDDDGNFDFEVDHLEETEYAIHFLIYHKNGRWKKYSCRYHIAPGMKIAINELYDSLHAEEHH